MGPLSVFNYYSNNKKRFLSVFVAVALSVFLLYTVQMIIYSSINTGSNVGVEPKRHYSTVSPKGEVLNKDLIDSLSHIDGLDRIIPCVFDYTTLNAGIGSNYSTSILSLRQDDIKHIMALTGLKLVSGRLPQSEFEIVLHKQVAANKNLKTGDFIGRLVSKDEGLPGAYRVVGLVDGDSILSFASIETYLNIYQVRYEYTYGAILLPRENSLDKMNARLDSMSPSSIQISTLASELKWQRGYSSKINILVTVVNTLIILIVSSCIGFLCYIHFSERRNEFGLLWAIGFSKQQVINRAFAEVNGINLVGFIFGVILSIVTGIILNIAYFTPAGDPLEIINMKYMLGAACSPIFVTLFSLIPIWRMLKKLDPIAIIEGEK